MAFGYDEAPLPEKIALISRAITPADSPEAIGVIRAATGLCERFLKLKLGNPEFMAILTQHGEDVAVARWSKSPRPDVSRVLLWDDPLSTSLLLRLPAASVSQPAAVEQFFTDLLVWGERYLKSMAVELISPPLNGEFFRGYSRFAIVFQVYRGPELTAVGYLDDRAAWVSITFQKSLGGSFPQDMAYVAERFPPLRTRIPNWSTARVLAAIGPRGQAETEIGATPEQNRILLRELFTRGDFSPADFDRLADQGPIDWTRGWGLPEVIRQAVQVEAGERFLPQVISYIQRTASAGHDRAEQIAIQLLVEIHHSKRASFCPVAAFLHEQQLETRVSSDFLSTFCSSH